MAIPSGSQLRNQAAPAVCRTKEDLAPLLAPGCARSPLPLPPCRLPSATCTNGRAEANDVGNDVPVAHRAQQSQTCGNDTLGPHFRSSGLAKQSPSLFFATNAVQEVRIPERVRWPEWVTISKCPQTRQVMCKQQPGSSLTLVDNRILFSGIKAGGIPRAGSNQRSFSRGWLQFRLSMPIAGRVRTIHQKLSMCSTSNPHSHLLLFFLPGASPGSPLQQQPGFLKGTAAGRVWHSAHGDSRPGGSSSTHTPPCLATAKAPCFHCPSGSHALIAPLQAKTSGASEEVMALKTASACQRRISDDCHSLRCF